MPVPAMRSKGKSRPLSVTEECRGVEIALIDYFFLFEIEFSQLFNTLMLQ